MSQIPHQVGDTHLAVFKMPHLCLLEGGGALIRGEPVQIHMGGDALQSPTDCQILLRLLGRASGQHEDQRPRRVAHLEDQQVGLCDRCGNW